MGNATAQHCLLAEKVGFAFFAEVGFDDTTTTPAYCRGVCKRHVVRIAAGVLGNCNQTGHTAASGIFAAYRMAGAFRRNHNDVQVFTRFDQAKMNVQTVSESKRCALLHIGMQVIGIDRGLMLVRCKNHHDIRPLRGIGVGHDGEAGTLRLFGRSRTGTKRDCYVGNAAVAQILCVSMTLTAIAYNRDLLVFDQSKIAIGVVINFHVVRFPS